MKSSPTILVALLLLAAPALADDIFLHQGNDITGVRIDSETYEKVEFRRGGTRQTVDSANVRAITYGRTSDEFSQGMSLVAGGDLANGAANLLYAADEDDSLPEHVRATARVEAADALLGAGYFPEALAQYEQLLSTQGNSRHRARALLGKGRALFFSRQLNDAAAVFAELKADAEDKNLGEQWALEADFFLLWGREAKGESVIDDYRQLRARTRGPYPGIANRASLRMGRALLGQGEVEEAKRMFEEIISSRLQTDADVVAGAFNGRGRCHFQEAQHLQSSGQATPEELEEAYRVALLDFLRTHVSYAGSNAEQPEALYWAGVCFLNVASYATDGADDIKRKGDILLRRVRDRYPQSEWAQKAASEQ